MMPQTREESSQPELVQRSSLSQQLTIKHIIKEPSEIMTAKFAHEDALLATACDDGYVRIHNLLKSIKVTEFNTNIKDKQSKSNTPVNALRWRPPSQKIQTLSSVVLAANTNGHIFQFVAKTGKQIWHTIESDNQVFALDYCYDSQQFASAGSDNTIRIYDEETKKITKSLKGQLRRKQGHSNRIFAIKFKHEDHNLLASGGWDQNINVWDLRVGEATATLVGPKITGDSIDFRDDMILTGANAIKDQLQLWDYRTQKVLHTFNWNKQQKTSVFLNSCQFCPNSKNTILAAGQNQMKIFSMDDFVELMCLRTNKLESFYTCDSSSVNNKYLAGGKSGKLYYIAVKKIDV